MDFDYRNLDPTTQNLVLAIHVLIAIMYLIMGFIWMILDDLHIKPNRKFGLHEYEFWLITWPLWNFYTAFKIWRKYINS